MSFCCIKKVSDAAKIFTSIVHAWPCQDVDQSRLLPVGKFPKAFAAAHDAVVRGCNFERGCASRRRPKDAPGLWEPFLMNATSPLSDCGCWLRAKR
jgi:hypothetical protein